MTANLQLRLHRTRQVITRSRSPERRRVEHRAVLVAPRSKAPPRRASRRRCSPPRRACSLASDVLCRSCPASPDLSVELRWHPPGPASAAASSKTTTSPGPGRLLPTSVLFRRPATVPVTSPSRAGFERRLRRPGHPGRLDPPPSPEGWLPEGMASDPAFVVDFCNQNSSRAQPRTARSLAASTDSTHPTRAGLGASSRRGWGLVRRIDRDVRVTSELPPIFFLMIPTQELALARGARGRRTSFHCPPAEVLEPGDGGLSPSIASHSTGAMLVDTRG